MTVWLVYIEFQNDTPAIEGVFADRQVAEFRHAELVIEWKALGKTIYGEDESDDPDWDVDIHCDEYPVISASYRPRKT